MRCDNPDCQCLTHVDPSTHVPACPYCYIPLVPTEPDPELGDCPNGRFRDRRGVCPARGRVFTPEAWRWMPRENFASADLPPANGWQPIQIRKDSL